jgi:hypothetical protein
LLLKVSGQIFLHQRHASPGLPQELDTWAATAG